MMRPSSRMGQGYAPPPVPEQAAAAASSSPADAAAPAVAVPPVPPALKVKETNEWQDKPSIEGQRQRFPKTVKVGPTQFASYDLGSDEQLEALNTLMEGTADIANPSVVVEERKTEFAPSKGSFQVLLRYRKIQYKKLVPERDTPNEPVRN